jgi:aspartyl/asparaginyl beta-hydroxylase (cupin superfamily)
MNIKEPNNIFFWEDYLQDVPICKDIVNNFSDIRSEILQFIKEPKSLFDYPKYNVGDTPLYKKHWKAVPLSNFDGEFISIHSSELEKEYVRNIIKKTKLACPVINSIIHDLEEEGNVANVFISELIPGSIINPHRGWTDKYMRVHLGIFCDPECKITVGSKTKTWEEGKLLAFKDGGIYNHSVKHNGTHRRIILSIDILLDYLQQYVEKF